METKKAKSYETGKAILEKLLAVEISNQEDMQGNKKKMTVAELMHVRMVKKALDGDIKAYAEVLDRVEGKAVQKTEGDVQHTFVSKPLSELIKFTPAKKQFTEDGEIVDTPAKTIELKESEPNVFRFDTSSQIEEVSDGLGG